MHAYISKHHIPSSLCGGLHETSILHLPNNHLNKYSTVVLSCTGILVMTYCPNIFLYHLQAWESGRCLDCFDYIMACLDGQALYMVEFTIWRTGEIWEAFSDAARVFRSPDNIQNSLNDLTSEYVQHAWESNAAIIQNVASYCPDDFSLDVPN